jgi:osmoprotectant transport system substrate-binding protein
MRACSLAVAAALGAILLAGCGESGSSDTNEAGPTAQGCQSATGQEIVVLADDKKLQTVDNVIPAINAKAATPALTQALDKASAALTTQKLIEMNKKVVVERATSPNVAKEFAQAEGLTSGLSGGSGAVVVGAANFAENQTLAGIYAETLNAAGFKATVKTIGNRELYEPALEKGEVQVVPEYVGTLTEFLNKKLNGPGAKALASGDLDKTVTELTALGQQSGLTFGQPSEAADQNAFAVTKAFADKNGVQTLSDVAAKCKGGDFVLGGPPECPERPFCQPGLEQTYGIQFTGFQSLDPGGPLTKTALKQGRIQIGLVFSSDGELSATS